MRPAFPLSLLLSLGAVFVVTSFPVAAFPAAANAAAPPVASPVINTAASPVVNTAATTAVAPPCTLGAGPQPTRTRAVFVLDTSGSMRGIGDGRANIFGRVQAELNRYVRGARPDRVELLTFDAGLRSRQGFDRPAGTDEWNAALSALKADGSNTYLYRSLRAALEPLSNSEQYVTDVFVLTDGIDNDGVRPFTLSQALAAFAERGPFDRLHYLALGTRIPTDARRALEASDYADGLTVPLNRVPKLDGPGLGSSLRRVNDLKAVSVPFADGTQLRLATPEGGWGLRLNSEMVTNGQVELAASGSLPYGAAALLCAQDMGAPLAGSVAAKPARVLLRLNAAPPLTLMNPGADLALAQGEETALRYRAGSGLSLDELALAGLPPGLTAQISRLPGAREFTVRLTNRSLTPGQTVTPFLMLPDGAEVTLPAVLGLAGGRAPSAAAAGVADQTPVTQAPVAQTPVVQTPAGQGVDGPDQTGRWTSLMSGLEWLRGLVLLALAAGVAAWFLTRRRRGEAAGGKRRSRPGARLESLSTVHDEPPAVEGIQYSESRVLSLVAAGGEVTGVPIPLGGPFDLGQLARVPHLSGLRAEQHRDGLQVLRVPADLEVSQGARLVVAGDVVRPGTLLGVAVARAGRAPQPSLGTLTGLGLPLTLHHETLRLDDASLRASGPYGQHTITLTAGMSDLGTAFQSPVLDGLKVTLSGPHILLVEIPRGLGLRRSGEGSPLQPGSYLPSLTLVDLPDA